MKHMRVKQLFSFQHLHGPQAPYSKPSALLALLLLVLPLCAPPPTLNPLIVRNGLHDLFFQDLTRPACFSSASKGYCFIRESYEGYKTPNEAYRIYKRFHY
ncbi:hypothetical protein AMECASPLE_036518 [Ameca splendens]|uniref:Uncharacterized protein n=1 Tax=Ameca splendens TaxID=208324 RepID=A0ABV0XWP7_9TELE